VRKQFGDSDAPQRGGRGGKAEIGHAPVLLQEAIDFLAIRRGGICIDATVGLAGHSYEIGKRLGAQGRLIGFDKDSAALEIARRHLDRPPAELAGDWPEIELVNESFAEIGKRVAPRYGAVDAVLADLGLSSLQLEDAARGFSFQAEAPLDMRMDRRSERTADQVVNHLDEKTLADVIYEFGEERRSRRIARAIVRSRPIRTTRHLAEVISAASRPVKGRIHSATRTFQAIRIFVNRELQDLEALLASAPQVLKPGGRLVIISFHSLEDRRVKQAFREGERHGLYRVLTKRPVTASAAEVGRNPKSRSAKLRAAERV
jgi:16S rRNA (cytosine1402-N4)-methyltransferase